METISKIIEIIEKSIKAVEPVIWFIFIGVICYWLRNPIFSLLSSIANRIERGDTIEAGTSGVKLVSVITDEKLKNITQSDGLPNLIYLTHKAIRLPEKDKGNYQYYRLVIYLDADEPKILEKVTKVIYHLHPTFKDKDREKTNKEKSFELATIAWGEFNMTADIYFEDQTKPLIVERYINFY